MYLFTYHNLSPPTHSTREEKGYLKYFSVIFRLLSSSILLLPWFLFRGYYLKNSGGGKNWNLFGNFFGNFFDKSSLLFCMYLQINKSSSRGGRPTTFFLHPNHILFFFHPNNLRNLIHDGFFLNGRIGRIVSVFKKSNQVHFRILLVHKMRRNPKS